MRSVSGKIYVDEIPVPLGRWTIENDRAVVYSDKTSNRVVGGAEDRSVGSMILIRSEVPLDTV